MFNFLFDGTIGEILAPVKSETCKFHLAIQHNKTQEIQAYLQSGAIQLGDIRDAGYADIHVACRHNNKPVLDQLVARGIPLTLRDREGNTTLHYAAMGGHLDLCKFLIERGVSPASRNSNGRSPYDVSENHHMVRQYLLPLMFQAESNGQGDPVPRAGGPSAFSAPAPVENTAMYAATASLMMPPPAYVGGYQIARAPQAMPPPFPVPGSGAPPANDISSAGGVPPPDASGGARSLNASLSIADQINMNKVQSIGVPGRGVLAPQSQDASPKSDSSESASPKPGPSNLYPVPSATSPRSTFQPPAAPAPTNAYPMGYQPPSMAAPGAPPAAVQVAAVPPPPAQSMMLAVPAPVPTQTATSWIPPAAASTNARVIRPDGFGSSASDPNLQKKYGHTQDVKVTAPPPIFSMGGPPPAFNPYSVSSAYGGGVPAPPPGAYAPPPLVPGVAPFGAVPPQVQPASYSPPPIHPSVAVPGPPVAAAPALAHGGVYHRPPAAAPPIEVSVFDPMHDVSIVASSSSSALM